MIVSMAAPAIGSAQAEETVARYQAAPQSVIILSRDLEDPRIDLARQALAFWRAIFRDLGLGPIFTETRVLLAATGDRTIESHARLLSQQAGRPEGPAAGSTTAPRRAPPSPQALVDLDADLVILLSRQNLMPFAWPINENSGFLVASRAPAAGRELDSRATRNEIAHELGHVLGLEHQRDKQGILMCMPCRAPHRSDSDSSILPLTDTDRRRLERRFTHP